MQIEDSKNNYFCSFQGRLPRKDKFIVDALRTLIENFWYDNTRYSCHHCHENCIRTHFRCNYNRWLSETNCFSCLKIGHINKNYGGKSTDLCHRLQYQNLFWPNLISLSKLNFFQKLKIPFYRS